MKAQKRSEDILGKPVGPTEMRIGAESALAMIRIIRESLPFTVEKEMEPRIETIDQWFLAAGREYTKFERVRNPKCVPWNKDGRRYRMPFYMSGPEQSAVFEYWQDLCFAMEAICENYGWQGVSDKTQFPFSMERDGGKKVPRIDAKLLQPVEIAARGLLDILAEHNDGGNSNHGVLTPETTGDASTTTWSFEPGLFRFRKNQYNCTPEPLAMLKYMVENPKKAAFSENDFLNLRGVDAGSVTTATIGKHVSAIRKILRGVATAIDADTKTQEDPLPKQSGGWRFLLPRL